MTNSYDKICKRSAYVFETTRTWHVNLDGRPHEVTAHWEGILRGTLVIMVDGEVCCVYIRDHEDPADPYGHFQLDGHELEVLPSSNEWNEDQSMNLRIDGQLFRTAPIISRNSITERARKIAQQAPVFYAF